MNLAIITARGGSKRIPRKNVREFCGRPIISYPIAAALEAGCFDDVMVSTDDPQIAEVAVKFGATCPFLRSAENSNDFATTAEVIVEVLSQYQAKTGNVVSNACCLYPTAPFLTADVLVRGYDLLRASEDTITVFPVTRFSYPIQRALKMSGDRVSMFQPEHIRSRSQDLEPAFHDVGQFYWLKVKPFLESPRLFTDRSSALVLPETHVQDIDTESDWEIAEMKFEILQRRTQKQV
jgi:pseudaminic acid cytidylyltransferase